MNDVLENSPLINLEMWIVSLASNPPIVLVFFCSRIFLGIIICECYKNDISKRQEIQKVFIHFWYNIQVNVVPSVHSIWIGKVVNFFRTPLKTSINSFKWSKQLGLR